MLRLALALALALTASQARARIETGAFGTDGQRTMLFVWSEPDPATGRGELFAATHSFNSHPNGSRIRVTSDAKHNAQPHVTFGANRFLVTWVREHSPTDHDIWGRFYDMSGNPLAPEFQVDFASTDHIHPRAVFVSHPNVSQFLVTYLNGGHSMNQMQVLGRYVNLAGRHDGTTAPLITARRESFLNSLDAFRVRHQDVAYSPAANRVAVSYCPYFGEEVRVAFMDGGARTLGAESGACLGDSGAIAFNPRTRRFGVFAINDGNPGGQSRLEAAVFRDDCLPSVCPPAATILDSSFPLESALDTEDQMPAVTWLGERFLGSFAWGQPGVGHFNRVGIAAFDSNAQRAQPFNLLHSERQIDHLAHHPVMLGASTMVPGPVSFAHYGTLWNVRPAAGGIQFLTADLIADPLPSGTHRTYFVRELQP